VRTDDRFGANFLHFARRRLPTFPSPFLFFFFPSLFFLPSLFFPFRVQCCRIVGVRDRRKRLMKVEKGLASRFPSRPQSLSSLFPFFFFSPFFPSSPLPFPLRTNGECKRFFQKNSPQNSFSLPQKLAVSLSSPLLSSSSPLLLLFRPILDDVVVRARSATKVAVIA